MRKITEVFIHTTATKPEWMAGRSSEERFAEITKWHKQRGFRTIGYHRIIDRDGRIGKGRDYSETGAHVKGYNANSIGVALVGGYGSKRTQKFDDNYTPAQRKALLKLLDDLDAEFGPLQIRGHNEVSSKACPGFNVSEFLREQPAAKAGLIAMLIAFIAKLFGGAK